MSFERQATEEDDLFRYLSTSVIKSDCKLLHLYEGVVVYWVLKSEEFLSVSQVALRIWAKSSTSSEGDFS